MFCIFLKKKKKKKVLVFVRMRKTAPNAFSRMEGKQCVQEKRHNNTESILNYEELLNTKIH